MGKVVIFGAGNVGRTLLEILEQRKLKIWIIHRAKYILCLVPSMCTKNSMRSPSPKEKEASPLVPTILYAMLI